MVGFGFESRICQSETIRIMCKRFQLTAENDLLLETEAVATFMPFKTIEFIDAEGKTLAKYQKVEQ